MMPTEEEIDETARLLLMAQRDKGERSLFQFIRSLREYYPELVDADNKLNNVLPVQIWKKYMGMDGRVFPTHDLDTGKRIPRP